MLRNISDNPYRIVSEWVVPDHKGDLVHFQRFRYTQVSLEFLTIKSDEGEETVREEQINWPWDIRTAVQHLLDMQGIYLTKDDAKLDKWSQKAKD